MERPVTTLFMLMSVDGKISTGASDDRDMDKDLPGIPGVAEGLHQYYEIEQTTDLWSLNSGRVQAKMGVKQTGKYDADTHAALMAVIDPKDGAGGGDDPAPEILVRQVKITGESVNIRRGNGTRYDRITTRPAGTLLEYVATAENGWHAVVIGNQVGWVSGNYSKVI